MRVSKHEHACLVIEEQGQTLVVDPGMYSQKLPELTNVVALTLSHIHDDHSFRPHVEKLLEDFLRYEFLALRRWPRNSMVWPWRLSITVIGTKWGPSPSISMAISTRKYTVR